MRHALELPGGELEVRERRHPADFLFSDLHEASTFRFERR
jgi:hypothetical protein